MDFNKALFGFIRVAFSIMIALLVLFAGIKICSICYDSVSYTHLDVYKRQALMSCKEIAGISIAGNHEGLKSYV